MFAYESCGDPVKNRSWFSRFWMGPWSLHFLASLWITVMLLGCGPTLNSKGLDHFLYISSWKVLNHFYICFIVMNVYGTFCFLFIEIFLGLSNHQLFWNVRNIFKFFFLYFLNILSYLLFRPSVPFLSILPVLFLSICLDF